MLRDAFQPMIPISPTASFFAALLLSLLAAAASAQPVPAQSTMAPATERVQATPLQEVQNLIGAGQLRAALARAEEHISAQPRDAQMRFVRGVILTELNDTPAARMVFSSLAEDFPELPEPHNNLAVLYAADGQLEQARAALELALTARPDYATARENLGDIYLRMAADSYQQAAALQPTNRPLAGKLGMTRELIMKAGIVR
jgi:tetratricopeptide (TPR) repeat protein